MGPNDNNPAESSLLRKHDTGELAAAHRYCHAVRNHLGVAAVNAAYAEYMHFRPFVGDREDFTLYSHEIDVEAMMGAAYAHASGFPTIGLRTGRIVAHYPQRTATFDPYPAFDGAAFERAAQEAGTADQSAVQSAKEELVRQREAAERRGGDPFVDMDDLGLRDRYMPLYMDGGRGSLVAKICRAYYDIVCAPKAAISEPLPAE